ncbi:MAG: [FeFe] hydrogenase H-cluster radical SAM maturase HydE [Elusimicrobiota bacterium]
MYNINNILTSPNITKDGCVELLSAASDDNIKLIFDTASKIRKECLGDGIYLRGLLEFSNFCGNNCAYCGLTSLNTKLRRYCMTKAEILESVGLIVKHNIGTVVLQSGEYDGLDPQWFADVIKTIRSLYKNLAITLSVGEKTFEDYKLWKESGADRFLLKMETLDKNLYDSLHPGMSFENRKNCLARLKELGYQTGSGNIVGLPNQTNESIANDLIYFRNENFDMVSISPFIPHPLTSLKDSKIADVKETLKVMAIARIMTKNAHIPATTALGSMGQDYRIDGLKAGANVMMPNFTPGPYREYYEIYPNKRCVNEEAGQCSGCMRMMSVEIGRYIAQGRGDTLKN